MNIPEWISTKVRVGRDRDVIARRLHGETLESIGKSYDLTREYVRQIVSRVLRYKPVLDEDLDSQKYWFETYGILHATQMNKIFGTPEMTYYYWNLTTKRNHKTKLNDLLADPMLPKYLYNIVVEQFPDSTQYKESHWHDKAIKHYADVFANNPYGQLTVIDVVRHPMDCNKSRYQTKFLCKCTCGNTTEVATNNLDKTKSCGCRLQAHDWSIYTCQVINLTTGKTYDSIKQAGEDLGIDRTYIWFACNGKLKTAGGYQWSYTGVNSRRKVRCIETGEIFESAGKAGKGVWQAVNGRSKTANGYHWEYVE